MSDKDVFIKEGNFKFNFRVAILIRYNKKVLVQKSEKDRFYSLIGGKVQKNEKTLEAIKREVKEELGFEIEDKRCIISRICENFFEYNSIRYHEILFIYNIELKDKDDIEKDKDFECKDKETTKMCWINIEDLKDIDLRPKEAKEIVNNINLKHMVINE